MFPPATLPRPCKGPSPRIEPKVDLDRSQSLGFRSLVREPEPRPSKMSPGWTAEPSSDPFRVDQGAAASKARAKTSAGVR